MSGDKDMDRWMNFAPLCNIVDRDTAPWKMCVILLLLNQSPREINLLGK